MGPDRELGIIALYRVQEDALSCCSVLCQAAEDVDVFWAALACRCVYPCCDQLLVAVTFPAIELPFPGSDTECLEGGQDTVLGAVATNRVNQVILCVSACCCVLTTNIQILRHGELTSIVH